MFINCQFIFMLFCKPIENHVISVWQGRSNKRGPSFSFGEGRTHKLKFVGEGRTKHKKKHPSVSFGQGRSKRGTEIEIKQVPVKLKNKPFSFPSARAGRTKELLRFCSARAGRKQKQKSVGQGRSKKRSFVCLRQT